MDKKERAQYEKLVLTPINQLIPSLAVPTVISMMITMIYNLVDAYFVGKLGTSASASIGILLSVQAVFQAVGFMFGHGSGSQIAMRLGEGNEKEATQLAAAAFFGATFLGIVAAVIGLLTLTPLMRFLGSTETILPYAKRYGLYILISGPALTASCVLNNIMRYEGKAFYAMIGLVSGGVINMIGDPILMFGLNMGIDGAGLSTAVSQYISVMLLWYMFRSGKTITVIRLSNLERDTARYLRIMQNGLPSLLRQMLYSVSTMTLNICSRPYGDAAIAAMAIVGRIAMFMGSAMIGIGQGFQPVSAYNYGARKYRRIRESFRFTWITSEIVLGSIALILALIPAQAVRLFRDDPQVVQIGVIALRYQCLSMAVQPIIVLANMLFQSIGKSREASFLASLRSGIFYIPALLILPQFFSIRGIAASQMTADFLSALTCAPYLIRFFRNLPKADEQTEVDRLYQSSEAGVAPRDF